MDIVEVNKLIKQHAQIGENDEEICQSIGYGKNVKSFERYAKTIWWWRYGPTLW